MTKSTSSDHHYIHDLLPKIFYFSLGLVVGMTICLLGWFHVRDAVVDDGKAYDATANAFDRLKVLTRNYVGLGGKSVGIRAESEIYSTLMAPYERMGSERSVLSHNYILEPKFVQNYFLDGWGRLILTDVQVSDEFAQVTTISRGPDPFDSSDDIIVKERVLIDEAKRDVRKLVDVTR